MLPGSRTPRAERGDDFGPVASDAVIPGITLVFKRSSAQENALEQLLADQQNTASPLYHQWLTPEDFAARFGVADEDIAATKTWLQAHGFTVESVGRGHDRITFSGTAAQVQEAFGTELHKYQTEAELHFAPASDLTLPAELGSVTAAVLHLSNFRPKPSPNLHLQPHPNFTSLSTQAHYLTPKDIATMYDLSSVTQQPLNGAGQGLAVVGQSFVDTSSSSAIWNFQANLTQANTITPVLVPGSGVEAVSPGDEAESEIDLEYSSGIATGAHIFFVYVGANPNYDVFDALAFAIEQDIAPVISVSYGICEPLLSATEMDQANALLQQAAAQGQTIVVAAGDNGSTACAYYNSAQGVTTAQQQALAVSFPADSPYVTAVGGTQMAPRTFAAGSSPYWTSATYVDANSSLLSYVPEVVWNEDSTLDMIVAGGGGVSTHFTRPAWQTGVPGIPAGSFRVLPDIALQSSLESPGFLVCSEDPGIVSAQGTTCVSGLRATDGRYTTAGGTSFAAPIFGGFVAVLNQVENTNGLGNINPTLYQLASNPATYSYAFHDIISGTTACATTVAACAGPGTSAYAATTGYDEATGLGSVDFGHLIAAWPSSKAGNLAATIVVIVPSQNTAAPGASVPLQINVDSFNSPFGTPVPTGTVSISLDGTIVQPSLGFSTTNQYYSSATTNYSFVAPASAGSHLVKVSYSGDAAHAPSVATYSVLVGNVLASGNFSLATGDLTVANGSTGSTHITITPSGSYSGRVAWSLSATTSTGTAVGLCYVLASPVVSGTTTTTLTIGAGSACNSPIHGMLTLPSGPRASLRDADPAALSGRSKAPMYAGLLLCGLLASGRRKTRLQLLLAIVLLGVTSVGLNGCGGSGNSSSTATSGGSSTTAPVTQSRYTMTLKGTDSVNHSITASTTFTLTVN